VFEKDWADHKEQSQKYLKVHLPVFPLRRLLDHGPVANVIRITANIHSRTSQRTSADAPGSGAEANAQKNPRKLYVPGVLTKKNRWISEKYPVSCYNVATSLGHDRINDCRTEKLMFAISAASPGGDSCTVPGHSEGRCSACGARGLQVSRVPGKCGQPSTYGHRGSRTVTFAGSAFIP
jgi:hypothetical protein